MPGEVKGQGVATLIAVLGEKLGQDEVAALRQSLQPGTAQLLDAPPLPMAWINAELYFDLVGSLERTVWHKRPEALIELGAERMRRDLSRVYRVLLRLLPTQSVISRVPTLWHTYTRNVGDLDVAPAGNNRVTAKYRNVALANPGFWLFQRGVITGTLKSTGASTVETQVVSGGGQQTEAVIDVKWS
jgi:hypothetical protein